MSNGHAPRHNDTRRARLANHTPWWRRRPGFLALTVYWPRSSWILAAIATALVIILGATLVHHAGKVHGDDHGQRSHAAATVRTVTNQHCLEALARADDGLEAARQFGESMASFHAEALALARFLEPGDEGRPVKKLQQRLKKAGVDVDVDGDYGAQTEKAVEEFREKHGKHADDSETFLSSLADVRERYETARLGCQLKPPSPTTGGGT